MDSYKTNQREKRSLVPRRRASYEIAMGRLDDITRNEVGFALLRNWFRKKDNGCIISKENFKADPFYHILLCAEDAVFILSAFLPATSTAFCFDLNAEMDDCARQYRIPRLSDKRYGFNFGFGSINDTEYMCRTRFHIKIIECVRRRSDEKCGHSSDPDFLQVMWTHTLDTKRFERAAAYICQSHNLRIFQQHKNGCLQELEPYVERCSQQTAEEVQEVVNALKNHSKSSNSAKLDGSADDIDSQEGIGETTQQRLKQIMLVYECKAMHRKLDCIYDLLSSRCSVDAVQLIMNYFIESLPAGCQYHYRTSAAEAGAALVGPRMGSAASGMQGDDNADQLQRSWSGLRATIATTANQGTPFGDSGGGAISVVLSPSKLFPLLALLLNVFGSIV